MGRLMTYLKQTASVQIHLLNEDGTAKLDAYGKPIFREPAKVKCRKEAYVARGNTSYGQFVNFTTTYYFDSSVSVRCGDLIDGHEVQSVEEYVDGRGTCIGYRVDV